MWSFFAITVTIADVFVDIDDAVSGVVILITVIYVAVAVAIFVAATVVVNYCHCINIDLENLHSYYS